MFKRSNLIDSGERTISLFRICILSL